jgi:hypothetical protein
VSSDPQPPVLTQSDSRHWRTLVWDQASVSAAPPGVFYARLVFDGIPYTGVGATHDAALSDLENQIGAAVGPGGQS